MEIRLGGGVKIQFGQISKMLLENVCLLLLISGRIWKPGLTASFESRIGIIGFLGNLALRISTPLLGRRFLIESLIFPRNTPNYRQADKKHQAFLQVNIISKKICMETAGWTRLLPSQYGQPCCYWGLWIVWHLITLIDYVLIKNAIGLYKVNDW